MTSHHRRPTGYLLLAVPLMLVAGGCGAMAARLSSTERYAEPMPLWNGPVADRGLAGALVREPPAYIPPPAWGGQHTVGGAVSRPPTELALRADARTTALTQASHGAPDPPGTTTFPPEDHEVQISLCSPRDCVYRR